VAKKKTARFTLMSSQRKPVARAGAPVDVGVASGRAAGVVLGVEHAGHSAEIIRASGHEGRGSLKSDGRLGRAAAPRGTCRLDLYAVAADGRAARASIALTVK